MAVAVLASCSKDQDPIIVVPPSNGSQLTLNGGNGGASAENAVYVDFSADKQDSTKRTSWQLGFYSGSDFKVILSSLSGASAIQVNKTDISTVTESDVDLNTLRLGQGQGTFSIIDDPREDNILSKTAIAAISATDADNKVYVVNPVGGSTGAILSTDSIYKIRVLRKSNGYTLQYAKLKETAFKTVDILKNPDYNFQFVSLFTGAVVTAEPAKASWDLVWSWSVYFTATIPYSFSDMVFINNLGGVTAFERVYASADIAAAAYASFTRDSVARYTASSSRAVIGSNWRATTGATGVKKDRFYVLKDPAGNTYKLKFLSFTTQDGGTRGKPQIAYELIK